jgi:uncharacterized protein (TIGR02284 family)
MTTATISMNDTVYDVIDICRDGEQGFAAAADTIVSDALKRELLTYSRERADFADALSDALEELGYAPRARDSAPGPIHCEWIDQLEKIGNNNEHTVLVACERGEDAAMEAYAEAMGAPISGRLAELISDQYQVVAATHGRIRELRDTAEYY